jgi:hypothetical protein
MTVGRGDLALVVGSAADGEEGGRRWVILVALLGLAGTDGVGNGPTDERWLFATGDIDCGINMEDAAASPSASMAGAARPIADSVACGEAIA